MSKGWTVRTINGVEQRGSHKRTVHSLNRRANDPRRQRDKKWRKKK